ncbi:flagellar hook-associated protein FlgL [Mariniblastus fucicola]|uniref:Flagellar hook-associated protein 3 n=1 Tax=Mariniblastus fucicola TaxID=980251 RepID=A0A5B9PCY4_9BACT|nr:flagellar hook-associated protein FlgL [Mariniblastus fucicola]QEG23379.1 Flagellar hook-associated protein 3 [Mariniblastus fucicola]
MNYRVTSFAIGSRAIQFQAKHNAAILKYQEQISSGVKLQRPSDDPIAFRQVTSLTSRLTELAADQQSLSSAKSVLSASVVQIQDFGSIISQAKGLAQQGIQALDNNEREALALEVDGLFNQLKDISQATFDAAFIYGGTRSDHTPFSFGEPTSDGGPLSVTYHGSENNSRAYVGEAVSVDTYYSGQEVFSNPDRGETIVFGNTGVKSGQGTDTLIGRAELQITHDTTEYLGGSGLLPGTDSQSLDTIIADVGTYSISIADTSGDGSAGTISFNGGPPVDYTNTDTNLQITGSSGELVYVDASAITPGFNGTVDVRATGNLSVDGGASQTPIDFSADQIVTDSHSGRFAILDTSDVNSVGTNSLEFPGTSDAFQLLHGLAIDLRNERGLSNGDLTDSLDRRLGELDAMSDHAYSILGEQSTSLSTLENLNYRLEDLEISVQTQLADVQATDIPEAILKMENSSALLQYTYAVTAQISSLGLLDFLR